MVNKEPLSGAFPEFSNDELVHWLQAKYRRHGEIEDGVAAERIKSLSAEVNRCRSAMQRFVDRCDNGQAFSTYTYKQFKDILSGKQEQNDG